MSAYLIESGADVNVPLPETGETPLHAALSKVNRLDYDQLIKLLLTKGADPNIKTKEGVETGAFMRDCGIKGETALHRAAAFGTETVVKQLLDAGAKRDKGHEWRFPASWYLRPRSILRLLCYDSFSVRPDAGG